MVESNAGLPLASSRRNPGSVWFIVRLSAPALKWQVAQAVKPSLPNCISQKKALPSAIAAALLRTRSLSSLAVGPGTATVLREASFRLPPPWLLPPPWPPPLLLLTVVLIVGAVLTEPPLRPLPLPPPLLLPPLLLFPLPLLPPPPLLPEPDPEALATTAVQQTNTSNSLINFSLILI